MANDPIQIKRGSSVDLPELSQAEFAFTTDNETLFIGSGTENIEVVTEGSSIRILSDFQDVDYDDDQVPTWNDAESRFEPGDGGGGGASQEDVDRNEARIIMNAFEEARNNSISVHGMIQGFVDEYVDEDGVDNDASSNLVYDSSNNIYKNYE